MWTGFISNLSLQGEPLDKAHRLHVCILSCGYHISMSNTLEDKVVKIELYNDLKHYRSPGCTITVQYLLVVVVATLRKISQPLNLWIIQSVL